MSVGMVIMRPTSIVVAGAGSSASVRAAGGVEFASATSLSLNGVFTADFDDYMVVLRSVGGAADVGLDFRMRASGSDNSTANSYVRQDLYATSTTVGAVRVTLTAGRFNATSNTQRDGTCVYFYGPALAQPTAVRSTSVSGISSAFLFDIAVTHNQSTSYDGFSIICDTSTFSGLVTVYGLAQ